MAHQVEKMAYAYIEGSQDHSYQHPWHKEWTGENSVPVDPSISCREAAEKIDLLWRTFKTPSFITVDGEMIPTGTEAIYRTHNGRTNILTDGVGKGWEDYQNEEFVEFCDDYFVKNGIGEINTIGSLDSGRIVFIMIKLKRNGFSVVHDDVIEPYFLVTNPHVYGKSVDFKTTMTRVVCRNTINIALGEKTSKQMRFQHNQSLDFDEVERMLALTDRHMESYENAAKFLVSKRYQSDEVVKEYMKEVFPISGKNVRQKELSRSANIAIAAMETQPGAEMGEGTWWQAFNAVTYAIDHEIGRNPNARVKSAWYGQGRETKNTALKKALEYCAL